MKNPKISVVMPVYNTPENYLREAIESILNQSFTDFEFLIIDDGSTSEHVKKCILSYHDNRIQYYYKKNSGIADTLNTSIKKATGEFIARMDADDISISTRFEKQVAFLEAHPEITLVGSWIEFFPDKNVWKTLPSPKTLDFIRGPQVPHPAVMWRKKDFEDYNLWYDKSCARAQDFELWSRAIKFVNFANIQEILLKYRQSEISATSTGQAIQKTVHQEVVKRILNSLTTDYAIQEKLKYLMNPTESKRATRVYLFKYIPLLKIKYKGNTKKILLFNFFPILKIKEK